MHDFLNYAKSLNPVVLSLPLLGDFNLHDAYQRNVSFIPGSTPTVNQMIGTPRGFAFHPGKTSLYSIAHGAEQFFTDQTVFISFPLGLRFDAALNQYFVTKRDAIGTSWMILLSGANTLRLYNSAFAIQSVTLTDLANIKSLCVVSTGSSSVKFYVNGSLFGTTAGLDFSTQPAAGIYIGGYYTGGQPSLTGIDCVATFSYALPEENISNLHSQINQITLVPRDVKHTYVPSTINSPVVSISGPKTSGGIIPDKSGNNHHAQVSDNVQTTVNQFGNTLYNFPGGGGTGAITITKHADINNMSQSTFVIDLDKIRSAGESSAGRIISKNRYYGYYIPGPNEIRWYQIYSGGNAQWSITPIPLNQGGRLVISHDRSSPGNVPTAQLNGIDLSVAVFAATTGTPSDDSTYDLDLGNYSSIRQADMFSFGLTVYDKILSAEEKRAEYLDFALNHVIKYTNRFEYPVSFSSVSTPNQVGAHILQR